MTRLCLAAFAGLALALTAPLPATAQSSQKIESFRLSNGLEVVVAENHRVPAVVHALLYRVGSVDDPPGRSGLAHFNEHMMFLGTKEVKSGDFAKIVSRLGGEKNASTTYDFTQYITSISKNQLPRVMELEADRMINMSPPPQEFLRERKVILEERRMRIDNNPAAQLAEQLQTMLFRHHPYRLPVIGWLHEMEKLSETDVLDFHRDWYHPNNAVLVLVGDITAQEAKPLVEKYYGKLPAGTIHPRNWNEEPPQMAARRIVLTDAKVKQRVWMRAYMAPSLVYGKKAQALPLYLFAQALGGGTTSQLYQSIVVRQHLAASISADYDGFRIGPGEFVIEAIPLPGISMQRLEKAIDAELKKAVKGIGEEALLRAKTLYKAEVIYARDRLTGMAFILTEIRSLGLPASFLEEFPKMIGNVTQTHITMAAGEVIDANRSVTGELLPGGVQP